MKKKKKRYKKKMRVLRVFCVLPLIALCFVGRRYQYHRVERNMEVPVLSENTPHPSPIITIQKAETGEGKNKITYFLADIKLGDASDLRTAFAQNRYGLNIKDTVSDMAQEHRADFAVNGDYYGCRKNGIVIRNGVLYRSEPSDRECFVMYRDGTADVVQEKRATGNALLKDGAWNVFSFGPVLVEDGKIRQNLDKPYKVDFLTGSISGKEPRTGIGVIEKNHFLIIAVDGRAEGYSCGMTFREFAQLFSDYGCKLAYNLDGGRSVTMYQYGQIMNQPCAGEERRISDMIYIGKGEENN